MYFKKIWRIFFGEKKEKAHGIKKYKRQLVLECWYAIVGTDPNRLLSFDIDLLVSKNITSQNIFKKME